MATVQGKVHWNAKTKKVVTTYKVVGSGPVDKIQYYSTDSKPFVVQTNARTAQKLGLQKVKSPGSRKNLYEVTNGAPPPTPKPPHGSHIVKPRKALTCGTLIEGHFEPWSSGWGSDN